MQKRVITKKKEELISLLGFYVNESKLYENISFKGNTFTIKSKKRIRINIFESNAYEIIGRVKELDTGTEITARIEVFWRYTSALILGLLLISIILIFLIKRTITATNNTNSYTLYAFITCMILFTLYHLYRYYMYEKSGMAELETILIKVQDSSSQGMKN